MTDFLLILNLIGLKPMSGEVFFDTNILLYLLFIESKPVWAENLVSGGGIFGVQGLKDFARVAYGKLRLPYKEFQKILGVFVKNFGV